MSDSIASEIYPRARQYRKKPVVITARHFSSWLYGHDIAAWCGGQCVQLNNGRGPVVIKIPTLEGEMVATIGDFIIQGVKGEFYPCKPNIFAATYEELVGEPAPAPTVPNVAVPLTAEAIAPTPTKDTMREALEYIANHEDSAMAAAATLHYDMRAKARAALTNHPKEPRP